MVTKSESSPETLKYKTWILKVSVHCEGCKKKVKKVLQSIEGVYTVTIDAQQQTVTVTGDVDGEVLIKKLEKSGKRAELVPQNINSTKNQKKKPNKSKNAGTDDPQQHPENDPNQEKPPEKQENGGKKEVSDDEEEEEKEKSPATENPGGQSQEGGGNNNGTGGKKKKKKKSKSKGNPPSEQVYTCQPLVYCGGPPVDGMSYSTYYGAEPMHEYAMEYMGVPVPPWDQIDESTDGDDDDDDACSIM